MAERVPRSVLRQTVEGRRQEYAQRIERLRAEGFTRSQARGHPGRREIGVPELRSIERDLASSSMRSNIITEHDPRTGKATRTLIQTFDDKGFVREREIPIEKRRSLMRTLEKREKLRKRKRPPKGLRGLPPIQPPQETP